MQAPFEVGILLKKVVVPGIVHFVAMVVDPEIPVPLAPIEQPHPEPRVERIVVHDPHRFCRVAPENTPIAFGSRLDRFLADRANALRARCTASVENTVGSLIETFGRLSPLGRRGSGVVSRGEASRRLERSLIRR